MHPVYYALAVILFSASAALAQVHPRVNLRHPLAQGLLQWHVATPPSLGGPQWYNLLGTRHGTLTAMTAGFGWVTTRGGVSPASLNCDGTDDFVALPSTTAFDFLNTTFTVSGRFRTTTPAGNQYLVGNRDVVTDSGGSFYLRIQPNGTLLAALRGPGGNVAARNTLGAYGDDLWHTFVVVYTTDTVTATNNTITVYLDGVLDQDVITAQINPWAAPVNTVAFCTSSGTQPSGFYAGALDNLMIHGRGLSASEVAAYHQLQWPLYGGLLLPGDVTTLPLARTAPAAPKRKVVIQ